MKGHGGGGGQLSPRPILQKLEKEQMQKEPSDILVSPPPPIFGPYTASVSDIRAVGKCPNINKVN